jgi:hypothetical protein
MSSPRPHAPADLALAPVLINIERNLAQARDSADLEYTLALALNDDGAWYPSAAERADRVQQVATCNVDLHGWHVTPAPDRQGLVVEHGQYRVTLMLGRRLAGYVTGGATAFEPAAGTAR